ncbi:MAG: signal peptide peptidase SppA [Anaerolineae bacterium]|nr:signal peptide peptidase SppA [Anaerolineae bacterium]
MKFDFWKELNRELDEAWRELRFAWRRAWVGLRNALRRARPGRLDYVVLPLSGPLPERSGPPRGFWQRRFLPPEPVSLQQLNGWLRAIADADNVKGVVFVLGRLSPAGLATVQNLRRSLQRLREAGKEAIVFTPNLDLTHYYVASAGSRIVVPPSAQFELLGLRVEAVFLKEALARAGVEADILQISPYKTAGNMFDKAEMTPEQREQLSWLLDDNYEHLSADIAADRELDQATVQGLVDRGPLTAAEALEAGLVDDLAYEDELPFLLYDGDGAAAADSPEGEAAGEEKRPRARLRSWSRAGPLLMEKARLPLGRFVGVVSLEGMIVAGESQQPPIDLPLPFVGGLVAGHETINRLLRRAERNKRMAALILHVDSGGGSALASDLIWRQLQRVARKKPVLVYMGNVAASGGYYAGAAAQHIMCQPLTLTGSIGVLAGRFNTDGLYERLHVTRTVLSRGKHATLYSDVGPLEPGERELLWKTISTVYDQFLEVVATGRDLSREQLEAVAGGRVWTGRQAIAHHLADSHGDFVDAVEKVAGLAEIRVAAHQMLPVANLHGPGGGFRLPLPFRPSDYGALVETYRRLYQQALLLFPLHLRWY